MSFSTPDSWSEADNNGLSTPPFWKLSGKSEQGPEMQAGGLELLSNVAADFHADHNLNSDEEHQSDNRDPFSPCAVYVNGETEPSTPSDGITTQSNSPTRYEPYLNRFNTLDDYFPGTPFQHPVPNPDQSSQPASNVGRQTDNRASIFSTLQSIIDTTYLMEDAQRINPRFTTTGNDFLLRLCFIVNIPIVNTSVVNLYNLRTWITTSDGEEFGINLTRSITAGCSCPDDFALAVFALLSYYRILNHNQPFVPIQNYEDYPIALACLDPTDNVQYNGGLLERVAYSIIDVCKSLRPDILEIPFLRPYQLDACMEQRNQWNLRLHVYCCARISKPCLHQPAVNETNAVLGMPS